MTIIRVENLAKTYYSEKAEVAALVDIDMELHEGDFTVIMGSSGSGKTTLLHMLSGLESPDEGTVFLKDQPVHAMSERDLSRFRRRHVGYVFQDFNLIPNLTVLENMLVPGFLVTNDRRELIERAQALLATFEIADTADRLPTEISGGEQQKASIARALVNTPAVLFADEPTGNLNSVASQSVLNVLTDMNRRGHTIVMATHDLKAACRGRTIRYLRDGRLHSVYRRPVLSDRIDENELFEWLSARGW